MRKLPLGDDEIQEYYNTAPQIIAQINKEDNSEEVYDNLYMNVIKPCVMLINEGKNEEAHQKYKEMVTSLKEQYC